MINKNHEKILMMFLRQKGSISKAQMKIGSFERSNTNNRKIDKQQD